MNVWIPRLLSCVLLAAGAATAAPVRLYVSSQGDDAWTGSKEKPFATLARARDELRKLKRAGRLAYGAIVEVAPGLYRLAEPFALTAEDSGTRDGPIVWRGAGPRKTRLRAARVLSGFKPYRGKILQLDLRAAGLADLRFNQLFFRGKRQVLARYPNLDPNDVHGGKWAHVAGVPGPNNYRVFYYGSDESHHWAHPEDGSVPNFAGRDWSFRINGIAEHVPAERKIVLKGRTWCPLAIGDRYYVQGLFEELDAPGEWYRDPRTHALYFWPPQPLRPGDVEVPTADSVVVLDRCAFVTVRGFDLGFCNRDAVRARNGQDCLIAGNVITNAGAWGVVIEGGERVGAQGNDVSWCGHGGISIRAGDRDTLRPGRCFADNNYIHHCANLWLTYRPGVRVSGVGNRVSHNLIHDMPHAGILLGGNDNVVEYNVVHHVNLQSTDTAGIYFCSRDWTQRGNVIRYNVFHHCGGFGKRNSWRPLVNGRVEFVYPHFTWGIYLDDPTTGTTVFGNIIYNAPMCALHNHGGRDNVWANNIVVDSPVLNAGQLSPNWSEWPAIFRRLKMRRRPGSPYLKKYPEIALIKDTHPEEMTGLKVVRNIFYFTRKGTAWIRRERGGKAWGGPDAMLLYSLRMRPYDFERNTWDYNCVYLEPGLSPRVSLTLKPARNKLYTWEEWRRLGADTHSVLADPRFVDPAKHDYRLRPDSPALKLGFQPIPVDKIGPYKDALRASWPIAEAKGAAALGEFTTRRYYEPPMYRRTPAREFVARGGLPNFFAKARAGRGARVAYFGGGIHPRSGWRKPVMQWLRERAGGKLEEIDAGICDCVRGSAFSVFRFRREVLDKRPDLVLVDFASDDHATSLDAIMRNIEGVIRQARRADPNLDVLFLYAFRAGEEKSFAEGLNPAAISAYEHVADRYAAPSINMACRVAKLYRQGRLLLKAPGGGKTEGKLVFSKDGVRPSADGNRIYAETIIDALRRLARNARPRPHPLPAPLLRDNKERAREVRITRAMLSGAWRRTKPEAGGRSFAAHFDELWVTTTPGAKLAFRFKGTYVDLCGLRGPDTGVAKVTVDGRTLGVRKQVDRWCYYQRLSALRVAAGLADKPHTVEIELLPAVPDRSEPIAEAKRLKRYAPKLFQGVALRFGWIRIVGEPLGE